MISSSSIRLHIPSPCWSIYNTEFTINPALCTLEKSQFVPWRKPIMSNKVLDWDIEATLGLGLAFSRSLNTKTAISVTIRWFNRHTKKISRRHILALTYPDIHFFPWYLWLLPSETLLKPVIADLSHDLPYFPQITRHLPNHPSPKLYTILKLVATECIWFHF